MVIVTTKCKPACTLTAIRSLVACNVGYHTHTPNPSDETPSSHTHTQTNIGILYPLLKSQRIRTLTLISQQLMVLMTMMNKTQDHGCYNELKINNKLKNNFEFLVSDEELQ